MSDELDYLTLIKNARATNALLIESSYSPVAVKRALEELSSNPDIRYIDFTPSALLNESDRLRQTKEMLSIASKYKSLHYLELNNIVIDDRTIEVMDSLPHLTTLVIEQPISISPSAAYKLGKNTSKYDLLHISGADLSDGNFIHGLESSPDKRVLSHLLLDYSHLPPNSLSVLAQFPNLLQLNLSNTKIADSEISDENLAELAPLKEMRKLDVSFNIIGSDGLKSIYQQFPKLKELDVSYNNVRGLPDIKHEALDRLKLRKNPISDEGFINIGKAHNLTGLVIDGTNVSEKGLGLIFELKNLDYLEHPDVSIPMKQRIDTYIDENLKKLGEPHNEYSSFHTLHNQVMQALNGLKHTPIHSDMSVAVNTKTFPEIVRTMDEGFITRS